MSAVKMTSTFQVIAGATSVKQFNAVIEVNVCSVVVISEIVSVREIVFIIGRLLWMIALFVPGCRSRADHRAARSRRSTAPASLDSTFCSCAVRQLRGARVWDAG